MPLTLTLPADLESQLKLEAERDGTTEEEVVLKMLRAKLDDPADSMSSQERAAKVKEMFARWEKAAVEKNSGTDGESEEDFFEAMNRSRGSGRLLYPPELKGISW